MTTRKTGKVWLGIGAALLLGSGISNDSDAADPSPHGAQAQGSPGSHAGHMTSHTGAEGRSRWRRRRRR